ncbi:MAG: molybdopterin-dependent oxidoreductase [Dermatophilaceae bacterium]
MTTATPGSAIAPVALPPRRRWYAVGGVLAAAGAAGVGHLVAAAVSPEASPVPAVGSTIIDIAPAALKEWAISTFGTADKPILLGSVLVVALAGAGAVGVCARRRRTLGLSLLAALALLTCLASALRPASTSVDVIPGALTAVAGVGLASWFFGLLDRWGRAASDPTSGASPGRGAEGRGGAQRRQVLTAAAGLGAVAATGGTLGQVLSRSTASTTVVLPAPAEALGPLPPGVDAAVRGVSPFRTPAVDFYRIDTALVIPRVSTDDWSLTIDGDVEAPYTLTFEQLLALPMVEADITLACVSNEVGGPYVGAARWLGVRTRDLLERAGVRPAADQVLSRSTDGMTISTPIQALTDDRNALVAVAMNGAPLPPRHGFPARLVTPGLYGFTGATKWLTRMTATTYAADRAYWTKRNWATDAPVLTQSRIDTPQGNSRRGAGRVVIGGVAWAQQRGVARVEVRVDGGRWQEARLGPDAGIDYWRQWYLPWDAVPGQHELTVRATDATGATQPERRTDPFPSGATGWHRIVVTVD